jgi:hypothetical protein
MADGFTIDDSDLKTLAAQLEQVASTAGKFVRDAVDKSSLAVKNDWKIRATGMKGIQQYPKMIGYDLSGFQGFGATVLKSTIGPAKRGQGNLGPIIESGAPHFAARGYGTSALMKEQAHFQELLDQALKNAEKALTLSGSVAALLRG